MKLKNVLIVVKDMEKSKKFYHDLFGLDVVLDNGGNVILTEGLVLCDLYDKNKNKFTTHTVIAKKYWEPMEAYRPMEIKNPIDPEWVYRIRAVKKVNAKQIRYIVDHEFELEEKIRENRRPTLRIFGIEDGSPRSTKRH